jgi:hypothetical protein
MKYIITEEQYGQLSEMIKLNIKVGDTLMGGKFKNKKVVVKTIGQNEKGDITINGKPLLRFRILKEAYLTKGEDYQKKWKQFHIFMKRRDEEIKDNIIKLCNEYRQELNTIKAKWIVEAIKDEVIESLLMKNTIHDEQIIDWIGFYVEDNFTDLINNELGLSTKQEEMKEGLHDTSWENDGNKVTLIDLLRATKDIPVENISVEELKPHLLTWDNDKEEIKKIDNADLKYPILIFVDNDGEFISIIDGHHRAQKAVRKGLEIIKGKIIPINSLPKDIRKVFAHMGKQEEMKEAELTEKCWKGYTQKGMKTIFGKRYPNCVKKTK